jgi:DNA-binding XRE family transcriptional regulator
MSSVKVDFGAMCCRLKAVRKELELTQEEFGKPIMFRRQDIHALESGKRQPGLTAVYRIAKEYNISLDWLVLGIGEAFIKIDRV